MRRREFLGLIGGAASFWAMPSWAQRPFRIIGFLHAGSADAYKAVVASLRDGLKELGYVEGKNVAIEFRWANNELARLAALSADLVQRKVDVIVAGGGPAPALAAKAATSDIPIVLAFGANAVELGLVSSLNRPNGNITGVTFMTAELGSKRLGLLTELIPQAATIGYLRPDPQHANPVIERSTKEMLAAASALRRRVMVLPVGNPDEFDAAFAKLTQGSDGSALLVASDPLLTTNRLRIIGLAARYKVPAIYQSREFVVAGGLMSYGASFPETFRQAGMYAARILDGAKPTDLPFQQSSKFEMVINLRTAKELGLSVPPTLLARADEVIE